MRVQEVLSHIANLAPPDLAEPWDNVGLLLGDAEAEVTGIVVALDPSTEVLDFAADNSANLVVTHHPLFLKPPSRFVEEDPIGGVILQSARDELNLIAAHTNLDNADGGVGDALAAKLALVNVRVLCPSRFDAFCKLAVFVPVDHVDQVRDAMASAGAGIIGGYTHCSFQIPGTGTFKPSEKAHPYIGTVGNRERVEELRLEMLARRSILPAVLKNLFESHPYEEVAYDVYPLDNPGKPLGGLKVGELEPALSAHDFLERVLTSLGSESLRVIADLPEKLRVVAVCGGSGSAFIDAVADSEAEVFVTGDVKHHDALRARENGLPVIDVGHAISEQVAVDLLEILLRDYLENVAEEDIDVELHRAPEPPPWKEYSRRSGTVTS